MNLTWLTFRRTRCAAATAVIVATMTPWLHAENPTFTVMPEAVQPDRASGVLRVHVDPNNITAPPQADDPPVVGLRDVAVELAKWYRDGEAAGNHGDLYENRDRGHSSLRLENFPQLTRIVYSPPLREKNLDYGVQVQLLFDRVVLGNSSTAMTGQMWRSNARRCYVDGRAMTLLQQQYTHNHLYIYPEHQDYDPGRNGVTVGDPRGHGDVFCANSPYVLISQGSSFSDQDLLNAVACALAAFRPEVKKTLIERGLLMPTIQMIFRWCYEDVKGAEDYLSGKAHPTVFDGKQIHRRAMIEMAHAMTIETIPPMVRLAVAEETPDRPGVDYIEGGSAQRIATTPQAIARIHRTLDRHYRATLSAASSSDMNGRPLTYHWVVLRGDSEAITIKPLNDGGSLVEVLVPWHEHEPIARGSAMQSTRVDIGVFVYNGVHYSAPAFFSVSTLADESRIYDEAGQLIEVDHTGGDFDLRVTDWAGLLRQIAEPVQPGPKMLYDHMTDQQRQMLATIAVEYARVHHAAEEAEKIYQDAQASLVAAMKAAKQVQPASSPDQQAQLVAARATESAARKDREEATRVREMTKKARDAVLTARRPELGDSIQHAVTRLLQAMFEHPALAVELANPITQWMAASTDAKAVARVRLARDRLVEIGLIAPEPPIHLTSVRKGQAPVEQRLTPYEHQRLKNLNGLILSGLMFNGLVEVRFVPNYVDPMIASRRPWRDVYDYTEQGQLIGWRRYFDRGPIQRFTTDGARVIETDPQGRPTLGRVVRYELEPMTKPGRRTLSQQDTSTVLRYGYDDPTSPIGRIIAREQSP